MENYLEKLSQSSQLNNFTYIFPKIIYTHSSEFIGYGMDYAFGKTIDKINNDTLVENIIHSIDQVEEDTFFISERGYNLEDLHGKNVTYFSGFQIIDLDRGYFSKMDCKTLMDSNMRAFLILIVSMMVGKKVGKEMSYEITFCNKMLNDYYKKMLYKDFRARLEFLECLKEELKNNNPTLRDVRLAKYLYYDPYDFW